MNQNRQHHQPTSPHTRQTQTTIRPQPHPIQTQASPKNPPTSSPSSSPQSGPITAAAALRSPHLLSPEKQARQLIQNTLQAASSGERPLQYVSVPSYRICGDLVLYDVLVQGSNNLRWLLTRRFAEFAALNVALENSVRNVESLPPFPSKEWRVLVDHFSPEFLAQRQALLDNYVRKILTMSKLRGCSSFLEFLRPSRKDLMDESESPILRAHLRPAASLPSGSSPSRSVLASSSMTDGVFEPRSYDDEAQSERREQLESLSQSQSEDGVSGVHSESEDDSRLQSSSQIYPTQISFTQAPSLASPISVSSPSAYSPILISPISPTSPIWVSSEVSDVAIPAAQIVRQHVVFQVNIENVAKLSAFSKWTVLKRYEEFFRLDQAIRESIRPKDESLQAIEESQRTLAKLPLLPKRQAKLLIDHLQTRFIEKRRLLLEVYLKKLITVPELVGLDCVLDFLGCN